ncbi:hypothetical protein LguiA_027286 [Lonicera macranthoides]
MDGQNECAKSSARRDGRQVHLIERNLSEPNRIVGELLQPGGYLKLIELGLEDCLSGIDAQLVLGYEVYNEWKSIRIPYPLENYRCDVGGRCFHNGRFVQKLRDKASSLPNVELEQGTVMSLVKERGAVKGVQYRTKAGQEMVEYAPLTIVCDGSHSRLRQFLCKPKVEKLSHFVALVLENCQLPHRNYANIIIGYPLMVLYPISSSKVRFVVDLPCEKLPSISNGDMARYLKTLAPQVPPKLHSAFIAAIDKGRIRTAQTNCMPPMAYPTPGALLLGDSLDMRHPITGSGMTAALCDVVLIRNLLRPLDNLNDTFTVAKKVKSFYTSRKPVALSLNTAAGVGYKALCATPEEANKEIGRAFFSYLNLGRFFSRGMALLLSGVDPHPLTLIFHSPLICTYIVGWLLLPLPSRKGVFAASRLFLVISAFICDVMIQAVRQEFLAANDQAYEEDGRKVHLIERNLSEPNRIVGELLQPGGYLKLIELGLEDCVSGIDAQLVHGYEVYNEGKSICVSYPLENYRFDVAGRCFHNGRFVQKLRDKASSLPNVELEQGTVMSLVNKRGAVIGVQYKTKAGQEMEEYAPLTIVCDGSHSSLRQFLCKPKVEKLSHFVALVLENCQLPHRNYANIILGYPLMVFYPIGSSEVRFAVDLPCEKLPSISNGDMARYLKTLAPQVPPKLHSAFIAAIDKGRIRTMQTNRMPAMAYPTPGALLLGDSLNMRHPITGTGMTAALYDVVLIRDLLRPLENLNDTSKVAEKVKSFYTMRKPVAFSLNKVAGIGHRAFCATPEEASKEIGRAFFSYLKLGQFFASGLDISTFICDVTIIQAVREEFLAANDQAYEEAPPADRVFSSCGFDGLIDGRRVHLIERNLAEPNRIVGEALQPGGYLKLIDLGLEDCVSGIDAQLMFGYEVYNYGESIKIPYPLDNFHVDVAGRCFHHGRFVQKLREKAASLPNVDLEEGTVRSLIKERGTITGVQYKTKSGHEMATSAPLIVVCDGCHSSLRQFLCKPKVKKLSHFAALLLENCQLPQRNYAHAIMGDLPILFYPISSSEVRCLVDLPDQKLPTTFNGDMAGYLKTLTPQLPPKLRGAFIAAIDKGRIITIQTARMPALAYPTPGALLLGDALNMRHPITGNGMTAALYDVVLIRDLLRPLDNLNNTLTVTKRVKRFYTMRKPVAFSLNTIADASYKFISATNSEASKNIEQAFFSYLGLGPFFSSGAAFLVSGLNPSPLSLMFHATLMSIYNTSWFILSNPSPQRLLAFVRLSLDTVALVCGDVIDEVRQEFLTAKDPEAYEEAPLAN